MTKEFLNMQEAADYLGYSLGTLYVKISKKEVPHIKMGKFTRFEPEKLRNFVLNGRVEQNNSK